MHKWKHKEEEEEEEEWNDINGHSWGTRQRTRWVEGRAKQQQKSPPQPHSLVGKSPQIGCTLPASSCLSSHCVQAPPLPLPLLLLLCSTPKPPANHNMYVSSKQSYIPLIQSLCLKWTILCYCRSYFRGSYKAFWGSQKHQSRQYRTIVESRGS